MIVLGLYDFIITVVLNDLASLASTFCAIVLDLLCSWLGSCWSAASLGAKERADIRHFVGRNSSVRSWYLNQTMIAKLRQWLTAWQKRLPPNAPQ